MVPIFIYRNQENVLRVANKVAGKWRMANVPEFANNKDWDDMIFHINGGVVCVCMVDIHGFESGLGQMSYRHINDFTVTVNDDDALYIIEDSNFIRVLDSALEHDCIKREISRYDRVQSLN